MFFLSFNLTTSLFAQEIVVPLTQNAVYQSKSIKPFQSKKTRAILPFIDDFSYQGPYPDATLWEDNKVYINNTMGSFPPTRGVATFDGLNELGRPYFDQPFNSGFADSLTSTTIDLSTYTSADNIYFSFYYQPQGLGFAPESKDSLFLYFKNNTNQWVRIWQKKGSAITGFTYVIDSIVDPQFFHSDFQFRFVNIASLNTNDDVWNLDYIKIDKNRNINDTSMNDMAFSSQPTSILKNYISMPYRHFIANQTNEVSATQDIEVVNLYSISQTVSLNSSAREFISNTSINSQSLPSANIASKSFIQESFLTYNIAYTPPSNKSKVVIRNTYFYPPVNINDRKQNDTIVEDAVFDNYFAYDDGSAEKSYFLLPAINYPSKTALKFTLNEADTIRGLMVHFGPQVPTALGKYFSIVLYKSLGSLGINDSIILQEDLLKVQYEPSYNGFSSYAFSQPKSLAAGDYYIGITQPANFGSDSIYYGLDVNTNTNLQKLSYNVDGTWYSSNTVGSVMMRPIVGQEFVPTAVTQIIKNSSVQVELFPNPTSDLLYVESKEIFKECRIYSIQGSLQGTDLIKNNTLDISHLQPGNYILVLIDSKGNSISKKIYKL